MDLPDIRVVSNSSQDRRLHLRVSQKLKKPLKTSPFLSVNPLHRFTAGYGKAAMRIASSTLQLESSHSKQQHHEISESLRMWVGDRRPDFEGNGRANRLPEAAAERVHISDAGRAAAAQSGQASAVKESLDAAENDPILRMIRKLLALLTGKEVRVFDASELQNNPSASAPAQAGQAQGQGQAQPAGYGVEYDYHETYSEVEQTTFDASGTVNTADGREINFNLSLSMARSYYTQTDISLRLGDARQKSDPLVINFSGNAAQLTDQRFAFDLNSDGTASEQINFVTGGSGFLAFDRNGDGVINNGSELFGTKTGDGFAELALLDADNNGWIDENDASYAQLSVWTRDSTGTDTLSSLQETNVGAISLARVSTPFEIKDESNALQGEVRASGVYLQESGGVGSIQQIDLTV